MLADELLFVELNGVQELNVVQEALEWVLVNMAERMEDWLGVGYFGDGLEEGKAVMGAEAVEWLCVCVNLKGREREHQHSLLYPPPAGAPS